MVVHQNLFTLTVAVELAYQSVVRCNQRMDGISGVSSGASAALAAGGMVGTSNSIN